MLTFLISPFIFLCSFLFERKMDGYNELVLIERQVADSVAEESFRNIKTILSLGAQKFFSRYRKAVKYCYHSAMRIAHVAAVWFGLNLFTSQFADALMYLSAVVIVMGQRRSYPTELVEEVASLLG